MKRLLFILALCLCGCSIFRQPATLNEVSQRASAELQATASIGPTLYWNPVSGTKVFRIWRCPTGACALKEYSVGTVAKPFPVSLAQWQLVTEVPWSSEVLSYPVTCGYDYSVQAIGAGRKIANGGNVVSCGN